MFNRLDQRENGFYITSKQAFVSNCVLTNDDILDSFNFAYDMTFGERGEHRNHRSGGQTRRKNGEIFIDTFQGKLAEFAFYNYFINRNVYISKPDMSTMGLMKWDGCDFDLNGKQIAVKSTKYFGNLLLLETKDWDNQGLYRPNYGTSHEAYDYFVLIRVRPDGTGIMKQHRWLFSNKVLYDELRNAIFAEQWKCNIAGYISRDELVSIISDEYILPQNVMLNGSTKMDAENYYVQVGDMHNISELIHCI